ncbi:hypothetical protein ACCUM_4270 [Candidatus Accumulibacter phosphatis]|uniref:Uncharacterized protein n=1 Tax=Candidatus Accumulibacter phosphatis TaxID=327160 RepID=A0A5S4EMJ6_9PROT|nr:hypothetical protein ACCUM_4270 [Candidatus Accumulibacter phosphatis]
MIGVLNSMGLLVAGQSAPIDPCIRPTRYALASKSAGPLCHAFKAARKPASAGPAA